MVKSGRIGFADPATRPPAQAPAGLGDTASVRCADDEITETEARLLDAYGPLEMARVIESLSDELAWIEAFAQIRAKDESKVFARVNRGALRNIAERAGRAIESASA